MADIQTETEKWITDADSDEINHLICVIFARSQVAVAHNALQNVDWVESYFGRLWTLFEMIFEMIISNSLAFTVIKDRKDKKDKGLATFVSQLEYHRRFHWIGVLLQKLNHKEDQATHDKLNVWWKFMCRITVGHESKSLHPFIDGMTIDKHGKFVARNDDHQDSSRRTYYDKIRTRNHHILAHRISVNISTIISHSLSTDRGSKDAKNMFYAFASLLGYNSRVLRSRIQEVVLVRLQELGFFAKPGADHDKIKTLNDLPDYPYILDPDNKEPDADHHKAKSLDDLPDFAYAPGLNYLASKDPVRMDELIGLSDPEACLPHGNREHNVHLSHLDDMTNDYFKATGYQFEFKPESKHELKPELEHDHKHKLQHEHEHKYPYPDMHIFPGWEHTENLKILQLNRISGWIIRPGTEKIHQVWHIVGWIKHFPAFTHKQQDKPNEKLLHHIHRKKIYHSSHSLAESLLQSVPLHKNSHPVHTVYDPDKIKHSHGMQAGASSSFNGHGNNTLNEVFPVVDEKPSSVGGTRREVEKYERLPHKNVETYKGLPHKDVELLKTLGELVVNFEKSNGQE